jgi:hypothetical protein
MKLPKEVAGAVVVLIFLIYGVPSMNIAIAETIKGLGVDMVAEIWFLELVEIFVAIVIVGAYFWNKTVGR